jgi:hypothetical protein
VRATHQVVFGVFGFAAVEKVRGVLTILGGPDDGRVIATRHGKRWLLPDGKLAVVDEVRSRPSSVVGQASRRTWPVVGVDERGREVLVEVIEVWQDGRWVATDEQRLAIPERGMRQDPVLLYREDGSVAFRWGRYLGRWNRDHSSDPGRWWRDGEREKRQAKKQAQKARRAA